MQSWIQSGTEANQRFPSCGCLLQNTVIYDGGTDPTQVAEESFKFAAQVDTKSQTFLSAAQQQEHHACPSLSHQGLRTSSNEGPQPPYPALSCARQTQLWSSRAKEFKIRHILPRMLEVFPLEVR